MPTYFAIFTDTGLARLATAQATGVPLVFTHVAVGDGNGSPITPTSSMTALVHEVARVTVNDVQVVDDEPTTVRVEGLIPAATGGFTIREAGLFNGAGELIAVANYPPIYKPTPADGVTADEYIRILLVYEAVTAIALSVDPAVIMATRDYVDNIETQLDARLDVLEASALGFDLGDGSDGAVDLDGTNTYPFATKVSSKYTLTRTVMATDFMVRNGVVLERANFPVYCTGDYTNETGAIDQCDGQDGGNASGTTPGVSGDGVPAGVFLAAGNGGAGEYDASGDDGSSTTNSIGGAGGRGGTINSGYAKSSGGTVTAPAASRGATRTSRALMEGYAIGNVTGTATLTGLTGGAGGGGGAGAAVFTVAGGGGAGGGGINATACRKASISGTIRANGGKGGDGSINISIHGGGGGGGGGGAVHLQCGTKTGAGTIEAAGGAKGADASPSVAGDDALPGSAGRVVIIEATSLAAGPHEEKGKAIFSGSDTVVVTFPNSWAYANASGINGYSLTRLIPYVTDDVYDGVDVWITDKTLTGFTIRSNAPFTGEVEWATEGF